MAKELNAYDQRMKDLELIKVGIDKKYGAGAIFTGDDAPTFDVQSIPTQNFILDLALGVGGLPRGRITEIYGAEGLGKSLICTTTVASCHAAGGVAAYVDVEHALDPTWAIRQGVKWDELLISQPDSGEAALGVVRELLATGLVDLIIVDSVAALTPQAEINGDIGDQFIGLQARMMSQALRILNSNVGKTNTALVFVNQLRDKVNTMGMGDPTTTSGGRALRFYSSVRIELKHREQIKDKKTGEITGRTITAKIIKNRVAPPFQVVEYDLMHGKGFNNEQMVLDLARKYGFVTMSGSYYYAYDENGERADKPFGQGDIKACEYLKENPEYYQWLKDKITATYRDRKGLTTLEELQAVAAQEEADAVAIEEEIQEELTEEIETDV